MASPLGRSWRRSRLMRVRVSGKMAVSLHLRYFVPSPHPSFACANATFPSRGKACLVSTADYSSLTISNPTRRCDAWDFFVVYLIFISYRSSPSMGMTIMAAITITAQIATTTGLTFFFGASSGAAVGFLLKLVIINLSLIYSIPF